MAATRGHALAGAKPLSPALGAFGGAALLALLLIGLSLVGARGSGDSSPAATPAAEASLAGSAESAALLRGIPQSGPVLGSPDAPVTLVEYADLQCPYCARWALGTFPELVRDYVRTGRVRMVFRGLAFLGPDSDTALRTALAAGEQRSLWNVVHVLYANQGAENAGWVNGDLLRRVGEAVPGLDVERMLRDRTSYAVEQHVVQAAAAARRDGIPGTPAFAVGPTGGRLRPLELSSLDADAFRARLDALLAG